ncbi:MAG: hypothetical protein H5U06_06655 [Candidatus Aminicenantes bacterium]|nr:hypothetical protein [Candidatus Aminicenantes bacterium]
MGAKAIWLLVTSSPFAFSFSPEYDSESRLALGRLIRFSPGQDLSSRQKPEQTHNEN